MYCHQCGEELPEGTLFCSKCGARQEGAVSGRNSEGNPTPFATGKSDAASNKNKKVIGGVAAVVVIILAAVLLFGGRSYKKVVAQCVKAMEEADGEKMLDLFPKEAIEILMEEEDMTRREAENEIAEEIESAYSLTGDDVDISYKITATNTLEGDDLEDVYDWADEMMGVDPDHIKAVKEVDVELTVKAEDEENELEVTFIVGKIGRKWYLLDMDY